MERGRSFAFRRAELVQALEPRQLLSVAVAGTSLSIVGTNARDTIIVRPSGARLIVTEAGRNRIFKLSSIRSVKIKTLGGNDRIKMAANIKITTSLPSGGGPEDPFSYRPRSACGSCGRHQPQSREALTGAW